MTTCEFLKSNITFLGHTVDGDGINTMNDKISAIKNFPQPQNVEKVRSFLGLSGYYRPFISSFARIVSPLSQCLRKEVPCLWNAAQNKSFNDLKSALINASVLALPDCSVSFTLYTDASAQALGADLMQPDVPGKNRAVAYDRRTLN